MVIVVVVVAVVVVIRRAQLFCIIFGKKKNQTEILKLIWRNCDKLETTHHYHHESDLVVAPGKNCEHFRQLRCNAEMP